ncbi:polymer-forming cytoskeletal protein, partial [Acinetobacter sp. RIT592]
KIIGDGKSEGNIVANKVKILGDCNFDGILDFESLKVTGDFETKGVLKCKDFKVVGSARIDGDLICDSVKVIGDLVVKGTCKINDLVVTGEMETFYNIECNNVTIKGSLSCKESINSKYIKSYGDLNVDKNIESEIINIYGKIICNGLLNAEEVIITPRGRCKCSEIGASNIEVIRKPKGIFKPITLFDRMGILSCNLIEGDSIYLEKSDVENIRGREIKLINKCNIGNVEYNDVLEVSSDSTVVSSRRV